MAITVRQLRSDDDRSAFSSGDIDLDRFFQRFAGQNQFRHHIGTTYVTVDDNQILGFATVSASSIELQAVAKSKLKKLPVYPLPVLRLARLAVDERAQARGVGLLLLRTVFSLCWQMAADYGCVGVVVDAKAEAVAFYERFGFWALEDVLQGHLGDRPQPMPMFLELGAIPRPT